MTFQAPYTLLNNGLTVLSGNVTVESGVTAAIEGDIMAESENHSIRKLGEGTLLIDGDAGQTVVKEGTLGGHGNIDHLTARALGAGCSGADCACQVATGLIPGAPCSRGG